MNENAHSPLHPTPGSSLDPHHILGRDERIREVLEQGRRGASFLLSDPRRMGKTCFLTLLCSDPGENTAAVMIDVQGTSSVEEFVVKLTKGLLGQATFTTRVKKSLEGFLQSLGEVNIGVGLDIKWQAAGAHAALQNMLESVQEAMTHDGRTLFIVIDELPDAIESIAANESPQAAHDLLAKLRAARRVESPLSWILCGSIGFHHILHLANAGNDLINDLQVIPLGPLTDHWAKILFKRLAASKAPGATDEASELAVTITGGIPFLLHQIVLAIPESKQAIDTEEVQTAFDDFLHDRDQSRAATHFLTRMDKYYPPELKTLADKILDHIAVQGREVSLQEIEDKFEGSLNRDSLMKLLDLFLLDHYLVESKQSFQWRYPVLRNIWIQRRRLK